jgi:hypothetical protein
MPVELTVDQEQLQALVRRINAQADGARLKREFATELRSAIDPVRQEIEYKVLSLRGVPTDVKLQIASKTKVQARFTGANTGVRISMPRTASSRFPNAPKSFDSPQGWRHKTFGRSPWFPQRSSGEFWDPTMQAQHDEAKAAILRVMDAWAGRF